MAKYHITANGEPAKCRALLRCPLGNEGGEAEHYDTAEEAREAYEVSQKETERRALRGKAGAAQLVGDPAAGRWCEKCKTHGTHHTDTHDEFLDAANGNNATPFEVKGAERFLALATDEARAEWAANPDPNSFWRMQLKNITDVEKGTLTASRMANLAYMRAAGLRSGASQRILNATEDMVRARYEVQMANDYASALEGHNLEPRSSRNPFHDEAKEASDYYSVEGRITNGERIVREASAELDALKPYTDVYDANFHPDAEKRDSLKDALFAKDTQ